MKKMARDFARVFVSAERFAHNDENFALNIEISMRRRDCCLRPLERIVAAAVGPVCWNERFLAALAWHGWD